MKNVCDALRDLLPFVQFKKREKHPWRSFTCSKLCRWYQIAQCITIMKITTKRYCNRVNPCGESLMILKPLTPIVY